MDVRRLRAARILVLVALPVEFGAVAGALARSRLPAAVVRAGPGPNRALAEAERCLAAARPELVVGLGLCGGLGPGEGTGSLAVPARLAADWSEEDVPVTAARAAFPPEGTLVSVRSLARSAEEKARLFRRFQARWVDQETRAWADAARAQGVPFAALRVVVDGPQARLPTRDPRTWPAALPLAASGAMALQVLARAGREFVCAFL
jgi:nucleoside phosphorylase